MFSNDHVQYLTTRQTAEGTKLAKAERAVRCFCRLVKEVPREDKT